MRKNAETKRATERANPYDLSSLRERRIETGKGCIREPDEATAYDLTRINGRQDDRRQEKG